MFFLLPIFFCLVSSDPGPEWLPKALLALYSDCNLSEFIPRGALKAELFVTYLEKDEFYGCGKYNIDFKSNVWSEGEKPRCDHQFSVNGSKYNLFLHPSFESAAFLQVKQVKTKEGKTVEVILSFRKRHLIALPHATFTSAHHIIVTLNWLDVVFSDGDVNRMFIPKNNTKNVGKLPAHLKYTYREDIDTLYGFSLTNGSWECLKWSKYKSMKKLSADSGIPCMEDTCFLKHPPRNSTVEFTSLLYATGCNSELWEKVQELPSTFVRFIGPEVIVNTTDPPCPPLPTTTVKIVETTPKSSTTTEETAEPPSGTPVLYVVLMVVVPIGGVLSSFFGVWGVIVLIRKRRRRKEQKKKAEKMQANIGEAT